MRTHRSTFFERLETPEKPLAAALRATAARLVALAILMVTLVACPMVAGAQTQTQPPTAPRTSGETAISPSAQEDSEANEAAPDGEPAATEGGAATSEGEPAATEGGPVASEGEPTAPATELAPIVIDADRPTEEMLVQRSFDTPEEITGFGETIFAEPAWRSFQTTAELIGESTGAQLLRQGGRDDFATLTIRGAPSAQLRILLDGVSLGRASDSIVNLTDLPTDTVERIEIYRGSAPVGLTPNSAAGVVNVVTRDPKEATAMAAAGGGSFGTGKVNAGGAGPLAGGSASAFAAYRTTDGDFDYVDDNGTRDNPDDDSVRKRANNDSEAVDSLLRWRRPLSDTTTVQVRNQLFYKEEGVPGLALFAPPTGRLETIREVAALALGEKNGRWGVEQSVTWQRKELSEFTRFDNTSETTASTTAGRWGVPMGKSHWLAGSAEFSWENFDQQTDLAGAVTDADRYSLAVAAGDDWTIDPLNTTLSLQLRHQQLWNEANGLTGGNTSDHSTDPRLGLRWDAIGGLAIKSNVSTYFRPPNFDELYGTDGFTKGNPDLKPETGLAWDAGFEWTGQRATLGKLSLGYSYFGSDIDDVILVTLDFNRTARAENAQRARIRGHELRGEWQGPFGLAVSANYTHQNAENDSTEPLLLKGKDLPGLAPDAGWARVSWTHGLFVFAYDVDISGAHYIDSENVRDKVQTRTVHNLSTVIGPLWKNLRLTLEADNIGNSLVPDVIGYPLPGRSFYATLSWSLPPADPAQDSAQNAAPGAAQITTQSADRSARR